MIETTSHSAHPITVAIIDDHPMIRAGLRGHLEDHGQFEVCGEADNCPDALALVTKFRPMLVVLDLSLPCCSGLDLARSLRARAPEIKILMLSGHDEEIYAERALRAEADGYLMKGADARTLFQAIDTVLSGRVYLTEEARAAAMRRLFRQANGDPASVLRDLTDRELEVFKLIGHGLDDEELGTRLGCAPHAIAAYREAVKSKLKLGDEDALLRASILWNGKL